MPTSGLQKRDGPQYHHGDLRSAVLRECRNQLNTGGLDAVSLRKAAQSIGVSHTAPARHFADKRALLTALAADGFTEASQALASTQADTGDALYAICAQYVSFGVREPDLYALMAQPKLIDFSDPALAAPRTRCFSLLMDALERSLGQNVSDLEARTVALWSFLHGFVMLTEAGVFSHDHSAGTGSPDMSALLPYLRSGISQIKEV